MKTMSDYTLYCTPEQTERAYKLGAPIATAKNGLIHLSEIVQIAFFHGYVYASLEFNGEVKI